MNAYIRKDVRQLTMHEIITIYMKNIAMPIGFWLKRLLLNTRLFFYSIANTKHDTLSLPVAEEN